MANERSRRLDPERSSAIVEALGGVTATARIFGITHVSVVAWKKHGIPEDRMQFIQLAYKKLPAVQAAKDFKPWATR